MALISDFWGSTFNIATAPARFSFGCFTAESKGDYGFITAMFAKPVGVLTILPSLALTAIALPIAFTVALIGTVLILLAAALKGLSNCVDSTLSPSAPRY